MAFLEACTFTRAKFNSCRIRDLVKGTVQKLENDADQDICKQAAAFKDIMQDQVREDILNAVDVRFGGQSERSGKSSDEAEPSSAAKARQAVSFMMMATKSTKGTQRFAVGPTE
ncbi:hypothetical protein WJX82_009509 [Trebouxia sp. C0006]